MGFYNKVIEVIDGLVLEYASIDKELVLVDAGCGDGTFIKKLCNRSNAVKIGLDISRDAILEASRDSKNILWFAADLLNIPLKDCCVDIIFNILLPANYNSFIRILKKWVNDKSYFRERIFNRVKVNSRKDDKE